MNWAGRKEKAISLNVTYHFRKMNFIGVFVKRKLNKELLK